MIRNRRRVGVTLFCLAAFASPLPSLAMEVALVGRIGNKAILSIGGGPPRTVAVGASTREGVRLVALEGERAVVEVSGIRQVLDLGTQPIRMDSREAQALTLYADAQGHFVSVLEINRARMPFIVDTGATLLSLGANEATRAGIDYRAGTKASTLTAAGAVEVWHVKVDRVKLGPFTFHGVDAAVFESGLPVGLLGMSLLNRLQMRREGHTMTLERRY